MSERRWIPNYKGGIVGRQMTDAEVLAEMGGYTATAAHSDFHLSWVIQVPGPGRYMVVKEEEK